jgi:hypothetical protein
MGTDSGFRSSSLAPSFAGSSCAKASAFAEATADKLEDKLFFDIGTNLVPDEVKRREALGAGWNVAKRQSIPSGPSRTGHHGDARKS